MPGPFPASVARKWRLESWKHLFCASCRLATYIPMPQTFPFGVIAVLDLCVEDRGILWELPGSKLVAIRDPSASETQSASSRKNGVAFPTNNIAFVGEAWKINVEGNRPRLSGAMLVGRNSRPLGSLSHLILCTVRTKCGTFQCSDSLPFASSALLQCNPTKANSI